MNPVKHLVLLLAIGGALLGLTDTAFAAAKGKTYCPNMHFICTPCKDSPNPPSSSTNPQDTCCYFQVNGWRVCSGK